jgi:hypothetical protein
MNTRDQKVYRTALEVIHGRLSLIEFALLIERSYRFNLTHLAEHLSEHEGIQILDETALLGTHTPVKF